MAKLGTGDAGRAARAEPGVKALADALERLAAGELQHRLPEGRDAPAGAPAFNRVAERLARAASEGASSLLDPMLAADLGGGFVAIVSIERFGDLRQQVGSAVAGEILQRLCRRLREHMPGLRLGRVGRTQIELAFPAADEAEAWTVMEKARRALERRLQLRGESFEFGVTIGFAPCTTAVETALENAATAMARAKASHARIAIFSEQEREDARERLELLRDLHRGMAAGELALAYQPKLDARSGGLDAAEALIRWRHPVHGQVPPDRFIGLAEETGAILDLTRWVVTQAIGDRRKLERRGVRISMHVNLSGRVVADEDFAAWLLSQVAGLEPGALGLEITETAVIDEPEKALANLNAFAVAGMPIAIDDYGSGLSSLAYLKELPATELKIDRMFVSGLTSSHRDPLLVRSTIDLAHALGMKVTAEGVETPDALALLRMMGCDLIQGYVVSPAVGLDELEALLGSGVDIAEPTFLGAVRQASA
jgi:EAL domain-containing protein (putative c-di-GMP-specific phosphodiesterase class I)/GGDEF domain-containing protein